ncbi:MAG: sulfatase-like hydrolase/transferase [Planctomycetales bacterium]|nr:sulfatase-like hydrolase/transferase [Planctomycetales bacterium]
MTNIASTTALTTIRHAFAWLALLVAFVSTVAGTVVAAESDAARPNIVLIISDDQAYTDFGFMGHPLVRTPELDRLASEAVLFRNGYVPSSVCRPSLVSILTGLYPHQHHIYFNHPPPGFRELTQLRSKAEFDRLRQLAAGRIRSLPSLPRLLGELGYRSLQTGKYWEGHWRQAGFTEGMTIAEPSAGGGRLGDKQLPSGEWVAHGNGDHGLAIGRETMAPIERFLAAEDDRPFFLWYAPFLPHSPHDAPQRYERLYEHNETPIHQRKYFASISQFDDTVGKLMALLDRSGKRDNTVVVFVVDNGWVAAEKAKADGSFDHTRRSKRAPFDDGLRTPIFFWQPRRFAAQRRDNLVSSVDLAPTLLRLAGYPVERLSAPLPGVDLVPQLRGEQSVNDPSCANRSVFGEIYPGDATALGNPAGDIAYRWVRNGPWKLIAVHAQGGSAPWNGYLAGDAVYRVDRDPNERRNLIRDEPDRAARLRRELDDWWLPVAR